MCGFGLPCGDPNCEFTPAPKLEWWGYLHTNGNIQAKRYFDRRDIDEAWESDFVKLAFGPFLASNRTKAIAYIKSQLQGGAYAKT